uniref:Mediator of RNA polymerase II transcription subunit 31 n=1 Tax=Timema cristinae TaxID=61476 RepID=A0A7R9H0N4_TIMCR|nr:unnamed protein product [Timema cristinae]
MNDRLMTRSSSRNKLTEHQFSCFRKFCVKLGIGWRFLRIRLNSELKFWWPWNIEFLKDEVAGDSHLLIFPGMMRLAGEHCSIIRRKDPEMYMHTGCHGRGDRGSNLAQVLVRMTAKNCFETDDQQLRFQAEQEFVQCLGDPNYLNFLAQRGYFKEKDQQRLRFQIELEFVQCLGNPNYLHFLAQCGYFKDKAFINYLRYLQYWKEPEYSRFLKYPMCLYFLDLLQYEHFRREIVNTHSAKFINDQEILFWQHYARKRTMYLTQIEPKLKQANTNNYRGSEPSFAWKDSGKSSRKNHPELDSNFDIPVLSSLAQHETNALANCHRCSPGSDSEVSEKLFSSGSSDEYEPSCSEDSSDEDSSDPLFPHRPNDTPMIINDNGTETINETKRGKKRTRNINNWKKITEIENDTSFCFFWHEGLGHRGVNEIATGVYKYIEELSKNKPGQEIVFYSNNCGGQQKNSADIIGSEIPCNLMALLHTMPTRQHYRDDYSFVGDMLAAPSINTPISVRRAGSHVVCSPPSTKLPMPLKHR